MREVVYILFGAAYTVTLATALGTVGLSRLRLTLYRIEAGLFAFVAGSACLSFAVSLLCMIHQARKGVLLGTGIPIILWAARFVRRQPRLKPLPTVPKSWMVLFTVIFTAFFIVYFFNALAPEISPDGSGYHLGNVARYWHHLGFTWDYHSMYSYLSQGVEMLYLAAFIFGRHSAAAMVHFAFLLALSLLIVCYGRRFGFPRAGVFAAILVYASPVIGKDGISAYNDVATATILFAVFYLLQVWDDDRQDNLLILIGLLCGFAYAVKYTAFLALPFAASFIWWSSRKFAASTSGRIRLLAWLTLPAALIAAPWILRNWIWLGNPVAPFFNAWFPNPYYHAGMEKIYLEGLRRYDGIPHSWEIPLQLALGGGHTGGLIGPIFLLSPFALLAWRHRHGRRLLLAALVFAIPAYFNVGARFLIPSLPFVGLAMGLALGDARGVLPVLAVFHALVCWPSILSMYCHPWAWRVSEIPVRAALRKEPEGAFIQSRLGDYALKTVIEHNVAPREKIFSSAGRPEAYIEREIVVSYESALGNLSQDLLLAPKAHPPIHRLRYRFLTVTAPGLRVVNIVSADSFWTVAEMRIFAQGRELPRAPDWRLSAWPNGWEVQLAFDNNYATRWSTWQAMSPHARVEIDFARPQAVDEVLLECEAPWDARLQIEVLTDHGRWVPLTDTPEQSDYEVPPGIRRAATNKLKSLGIRYLLVNDSDYVAEDIKKNINFWGVTMIAEANGTRFYRID